MPVTGNDGLCKNYNSYITPAACATARSEELIMLSFIGSMFTFGALYLFIICIIPEE